MPWEKQYNETEVLDSAMRLFWAQGYEGTSVGDLVAATGINRGSLYAAYDGKRSLFIAALRRYDEIYRVEFLERAARDHDPRDAVVAVFEAASKSGSETSDPPGCFFVNSAIELSPHNSQIAELIQSSFDGVESFFLRMIRQARKNGSVSNTQPSQDCAKALLGLFLGLRVLVRANADKTVRDTIISQARMMMS